MTGRPRRGALLGACAAFFAVLTFVAPARADDPCPRFEDAARLNGRQYVDLRLTRGSPIGDWELIPADARGALISYLQFPSRPRHGERNGVIFYFATGEAVCAYLWERGRMVADPASGGSVIDPDRVFRLAVDTPGELSALIERTLAAFTHRGASPARSPRPRRPSTATTRGASAIGDDPPPDDDATDALVARLSGILFGPIAGDVEKFGTLSILPALNIGTVPFAALDPDGDGRPLVASTRVNVEESLKSIVEGRIFGMRPATGEAEPPSIAPQAIAGDPDATRDPDWIFPRLPGAAAEARAIAERFRVLPVVGGDVTVEQLKRRLVDAEYIHIAAHGLSSASDPMDGSFLALTDGRLTARAIQFLPLSKSPLVVLSACQTGLGSPLEAGVIGLARAFIVAGASAVIASLWNVDDEATAWIMERFATHLSELPPAEALRQAQDEARHRWPDPAVWASFMLFGSRIVGLDPDNSAGLLPEDEVVISPLLRTEGGDPRPIPWHTPPVVRPDDELHVDLVNSGRTGLDVDFLYLDAAGATTWLGSHRLPAGTTDRVPLVRFTADTLGFERLVVVAREALALTTPSEMLDFDGVSALLATRGLVEPAALGRLLPTRGISRLADFGLARPGARAAATAMVARRQVVFSSASGDAGSDRYMRLDEPPRSAVLVFPVEIRASPASP